MIKDNSMVYESPKVTLLHDTGLMSAEIAARTCYDSFNISETSIINNFPELIKANNLWGIYKEFEVDIDNSEILNKITWAYQHHSILEHINLTYHVSGTSRGVLQEHARHRIQGISVKSTRYTLTDVINAFLVCFQADTGKQWFIDKILSLDIFITSNIEYNKLQASDIFDRLMFQFNNMEEGDFYRAAIVSSNVEEFMNCITEEQCYEVLNRKKKKNIGDPFKHIVNDNWKVDLVCTFNLRSLKNYLKLRDSGAAWFLIRDLAQAIKKATPEKYLSLIDKPVGIKDDN